MYVPVSIYLYIHFLTLHIIPHLCCVLGVSPQISLDTYRVSLILLKDVINSIDGYTKPQSHIDGYLDCCIFFAIIIKSVNI